MLHDDDDDDRDYNSSADRHQSTMKPGERARCRLAETPALSSMRSTRARLSAALRAPRSRAPRAVSISIPRHAPPLPSPPRHPATPRHARMSKRCFYDQQAIPTICLD